MRALFPRFHAYRLEGLKGAELERGLDTVPEVHREYVRYLVEYYLPVQAQLARAAEDARARETWADRVKRLQGKQLWR